MRAPLLRLAGAAVLVCTLQTATTRADLAVTNNVNADALANALLGGGTGGITVTNAVLSANSSGDLASSGIYTAGSNNYMIPTGNGVVITSGNAASMGTDPTVVNGFTSAAYGTDATSEQFNLLHQVSPGASSFHDVTELTITFNVDANTDHVFFNGVFTSAEYPSFVGYFTDGFGLFLNGQNIAAVGGFPVNIDSPYMYSTVPPFDGQPADTQVATQFQETAVQSVMAFNGSPDLNFTGAVTPGSTGNTLILHHWRRQ